MYGESLENDNLKETRILTATNTNLRGPTITLKEVWYSFALVSKLHLHLLNDPTLNKNTMKVKSLERNRILPQ